MKVVPMWRHLALGLLLLGITPTESARAAEACVPTEPSRNYILIEGSDLELALPIDNSTNQDLCLHWSVTHQSARELLDYEIHDPSPVCIPAGATRSLGIRVLAEPMPHAELHETLEILSRHAAYLGGWQQGDLVEERSELLQYGLQGLGYYVSWFFQGAFDFEALALSSEETFLLDLEWRDSTNAVCYSEQRVITIYDSDRPPLLAFRGTEPTPLYPIDFLVDASPEGVGFVQWTENYPDVYNWVAPMVYPESAATGVSPFALPAHLTGHSLGGALSQWFAVSFTRDGIDLGEVVTFNAPGIDGDYVHHPDTNPYLIRSVTHYVTSGDIASLAGEDYLVGGIQERPMWVKSYYESGSSISAIANRHSEPVITPFIDKGERLDNRVEFTHFFDDTESLSDDWFSYVFGNYDGFEPDRDFFAFQVALAQRVQVPGVPLGAYLAGALSYRRYVELNRDLLGTIALTAIGINTEDLPFYILDAIYAWGETVWLHIDWMLRGYLESVDRNAPRLQKTLGNTPEAGSFWESLLQWPQEAWQASTAWPDYAWEAMRDWTPEQWQASVQDDFPWEETSGWSENQWAAAGALAQVVKGSVLVDANANGFHDADEDQGIPFLRVQLRSGNQVVLETTTNAEGKYTLLSVSTNGVAQLVGWYSVHLVLDDAYWVQTYSNDGPGTDDAQVNFFGDPEETLSDVDFGAHVEIAGSLSGVVWDDRDGNGARDAGEPGRGGQLVYLSRDGGSGFDSSRDLWTETLSSGEFAIGLPKTFPAGVYELRQSPPAGDWTFTAPPDGVRVVDLGAGPEQTQGGLDFGNRCTGDCRPPPEPEPEVVHIDINEHSFIKSYRVFRDPVTRFVVSEPRSWYIGVDSADYACGVVGFRAQGGDINEDAGGGRLIEARVHRNLHGLWLLTADFRSEPHFGENETWKRVDVLCISRELAALDGPTAGLPIFFQSLTDIVGGEVARSRISAEDWHCGVSGFGSVGGDIEEDDAGDILSVRLFSEGGEWKIRPDFRTDSGHDPETWRVDLMCVDRRLSTRNAALGERPFFFYAFDDLGDDVDRDTAVPGQFPDGIPTSEFGCGIVGSTALHGDIRESGSGGTLISSFLFESAGRWRLRSEFRTHNDHENWSHTILCAAKRDWFPPPVVTGFSPQEGFPSSAVTVEIRGQYFAQLRPGFAVSAVRFGPQQAAFAVRNDTLIAATLPPGTGCVDVEVTTTEGTALAPRPFCYRAEHPPIVSGLLPAQGPESGGTHVLISGDHFGEPQVSAVTFGGVPATFAVLSNTQVLASTPPGVGLADVVVINAQGASTNTVADDFAYRAFPTTPGFLPSRSWADAPGSTEIPAHLALADFDRDGHVDVALLEDDPEQPGYSLAIFRNAGQAMRELAFFPKESFPVATSRTLAQAGAALLARDVDGDGASDLVIANARGLGGSVSVLRNTSRPPDPIDFHDAGEFAVAGEAVDVKAADLDRDGLLDLVVATGASGVSILRSESSPGNVVLGEVLTLETERPARALAVVDLDGDGDQDLVVGERDAAQGAGARRQQDGDSYGYEIFLNTSLGIATVRFAPPLQRAFEFAPGPFALGDLDVDGRWDLVQARPASNKLTVELNQTPPGGTIQLDGILYHASGIRDVAVADIDLDGRPDVVSANGEDGTALLWRTRAVPGGIQLEPPVARSVGALPQSLPTAIAVADLDGDGLPDVVSAEAASDSFSVLLLKQNPPLLPAAPVALAALAAGPPTRVELSWSHDLANTTHFEVFRDDGSGFTRIAQPATNQLADHDVSPGAYTYVVRALNGELPSNYSDPITIEIPAPPAQPDSLTVSSPPGTFSVVLSWTDNSIGEDGFEIARGVDGGAFSSLDIIGPHAGPLAYYSDGILDPGKTYAYRVRAFTAGGYSDWSNEAAITLPHVLPEAPHQLEPAQVALTSVQLSWIDRSSNEDEFAIERSSLPCLEAKGFVEVGATGSPGVTSWVDGTVVGQTPYSYRILARNAAGSSDPSNCKDITTASAPPAAPSGLQVEVEGLAAARLSWQDNSSDEVEFVVERMEDDGVFLEIVRRPADATAHLDFGLAPAATYTYRVAARNAAGLSAWSTAPAVTTPANPGAPEISALSPRQGAATGVTAIRLTGARLTGARRVTFGTVQDAAFSVLGSTEMVVFAPPGAGVRDVRVITDQGGSPNSAADDFSSMSAAGKSFGVTVTLGDPSSGGDRVPAAVAEADFDGDGWSDLAVLEDETDPEALGYSISVYRNTSSADGLSFAPKLSLDIADGILARGMALVAADLNGDGKTDLAVAETNGLFGSVRVLRNTSPPLSPPPPSPITFIVDGPFGQLAEPHDLVAGDFDRDGRAEIAVATGGATNAAVVLRNLTTGSAIVLADDIVLSLPESAYTLEALDLEEDGDLDLVLATCDEDSAGQTSVCDVGDDARWIVAENLTGGPGSFAWGTPLVVSSSWSPSAMTWGDLDDDRRFDLALVSPGDNMFSVLLNQSAGGAIAFDGEISRPAGVLPRDVTVVDLDLDGVLDLAVAEQGSDSVAALVLEIGPDGFQVEKHSYPVGRSPVGLARGDFDGDGLPDLAVIEAADDALTILLWGDTVVNDPSPEK